ncbi:MAG: PLP-dependent aminotransferase family protein [Bacillota bacterium]|nr:PLP-dependent aminotransferase family protein [Bacillota bacterium]
MDIQDYFSDLTRQQGSRALAELFQLTERPDIISFAGGFPAPEMFLPGEAAEITRQLLVEEPSTVLGYSPTPGFSALREFLADRQSRLGMPAAASELMVTSGSLQGLDILGRVFLNRGDRIIVEAPNYLGALSTFASYDVKIDSVPVDAEGLDTARLSELLEQRRRQGSLPKLLYTVPTFQNPSGQTMSHRRRQELLTLADSYGLLIIEDNAYGELRFVGEEVPTLKALDTGGYVIYLGTFSKILSPGIRIGWIHAAAEIIERAILVRQAMDQCSNSLGQLLALEFGRRGLIEKQINKTVRLLGERARLTLDLLARDFPAGTTWTNPEGGFYTWVTLPPEIDTAQLLPHCIEKARVAYVAGVAFYAGKGGNNQMRLCYSQPGLDDIARGIPRLARALKTKF